MIGRRQLKFPAETFRSIQLWLTIAVLVLAPLFFGSVDLFWVATWTILLSISVLCGVAASPIGPGQGRVLLAFLALCCVYASVSVVQGVPHVIDRFDDLTWQRANDLLGLTVPPRI